MKKIISGLCAISIFFSTGSAFVSYDIPLRAEKIIPIYFVADEEEILESIDLSEYKDVEIIDYEMTKGKGILEINDEELILDLYDGNYFSGVSKHDKTKTEDIENVILQNNKAIFMPQEKIKNIITVNGDFESGVIDGEKVILELAKDATGVKGYNQEKIIKSNIAIEVDRDNSEETIKSDFYELHEMPEDSNIKVKNVNLDGKATFEIDGNKVRVLFADGIPQIIETTKKDGYGYYWVDRAVNGTFRDRYPNSIYRSDRYYFDGEGEYVSDERLVIERSFDDSWKDYVGFIVDNQKYVYLLSDVPEGIFQDAIVLKQKSNIFTATSLKEQDERNWFNTSKLIVKITDDSVMYIPSGNLYSMGELVEELKGWGEIMPNRSDESTESFYNDITGKIETYVRHFKFFYGPKEKETFGGTVTYPYEAILEYEHYKPEILYNGAITYVYEEAVEDKGYEFNGWVKISYDETKRINDYPPKPPYNVIYNNSLQVLSWQSAIDDYTKENEMIYEIEIERDNSFVSIGCVQGKTELDYKDDTKNKFRVRARDNQNQYSQWAYSDDKLIEIVGEIKPQEVFAGEKIDILATIKSLSNITSVQAYSQELNVNEELIKISGKVPNAIEVSFNLLNHTGKEPWLIVDDMYYAAVNGEEIKIKSFASNAETKGNLIDVELPENIIFTENGTLIFPNQNYSNIPCDVTKINDDLWYFYSTAGIYFMNDNTGNQEIFVRFINDNKASLVNNKEKIEITPYIEVNLFDYINGKPQYLQIPISFEIATKPIAITWRTNENKIQFVVYADGEILYSYDVLKENVVNNIKSFNTYSLGRSVSRMLRNSVGYCYHYKDKSYSWANMYNFSNVLTTSWLGYKLKGRTESTVFEEYNNLSSTRDVNRLVILDESISENAINVYISKMKSTNVMIDRKNKETVFADEIQENIGDYEVSNVVVDETAKTGEYDIIITAVDENGYRVQTIVPLIVKEKNVEKESFKDKVHVGRFYYANNNMNEKYVEELSLTKFNLETLGFISAGETLAIVVDDDTVESVIVDFVGDKSIKHVDNLTKKFLNEDLEYKFPLTLYPNENGIFVYKIPYGTKQTLESWATLREKSGDFENINKEGLFNRIKEPYQVKVQIDGEELIYTFDVFERWDTILNRDASKYIINSKQKWRIKL